MTSLTYRMDAGIAGDVTRKSSATIAQGVFDATNPPIAYGVPVGVDATSKNIRGIIAADVASIIRGFLVRPFPVSNPNTSDGLGTSSVNTTQVANVLRRGYINVKVNAGTAAKAGQAYVRTANPSGAKVIGGVEATLEWGSSSAAKSGGNTGNGTLVLDATTPVSATAIPGVYTVRNIVAATNGGQFEVKDPNGRSLGVAILAAGTFTFNNLVKFVITDGGTDFIVGDGFDITVVANTLAIPGALFEGAADANGNTELAYNM